jgi:predicted nucleic-acid-binding Zn-ribbon protein
MDDQYQACVKCGSVGGWDGPVYMSSTNISTRISGGRPAMAYDYVYHEWLSFTCRTCGYVRAEHTRDYQEPERAPVQVIEPPSKPKYSWWFHAWRSTGETR